MVLEPGAEPRQGRPLAACHSSWPSRSSVSSRSWPSKSPAVKIMPSAIETPEYPSPHCEYFQISRGPPGGHFFSSPVSVEMFVRPGPWNSGQLAPRPVWPARNAGTPTSAAAKIAPPRANRFLLITSRSSRVNANPAAGGMQLPVAGRSGSSQMNTFIDSAVLLAGGRVPGGSRRGSPCRPAPRRRPRAGSKTSSAWAASSPRSPS